MNKDEHFHSKEKGCELVIDKFLLPESHRKQGSRGYLVGKYCRTHFKDVCRCGWERGWHYGNEAAKLKGNKRGKGN